MLINSFYNIVSSTQLADGSYRYEVSLDGRHEIFKGHFPKLPVLPGVCILQIVKDIVEDIVGYKLRLRQAQYLSNGRYELGSQKHHISERHHRCKTDKHISIHMKKIIYISLLLCLSLTATAQDDIRAAFPRASDTKERAAAFYEMMSRKSTREPLVQAYLGAAQMIYAKYFTKNRQEYLRRGKENIEAAIRQSPQSIEIRMIRLSIQENLPKIVPYHRNIAEDKRFILDHIDSQDDILKEYILAYIARSKSFADK